MFLCTHSHTHTDTHTHTHTHTQTHTHTDIVSPVVLRVNAQSPNSHFCTCTICHHMLGYSCYTHIVLQSSLYVPHPSHTSPTSHTFTSHTSPFTPSPHILILTSHTLPLTPSPHPPHLTHPHLTHPHPHTLTSHTTLLTPSHTGQERFQSITNRFYSDTHAVVIVYDVTSEESFHDVDFWVREVQYYLPQELDNGMPVLFMGNKRDLLDRNNEDQKSVKFRQVQEIANAYGFLKPIECSAKTGDNVKKAFTVLAAELVQRRPKRGVVVNTARKKGCCNLL